MKNNTELENLYESIFNIKFDFSDELLNFLVKKYIDGVPISERFSISKISPVETLKLNDGFYDLYQMNFGNKIYINQITYNTKDTILKEIEIKDSNLYNRILENNKLYAHFKFREGAYTIHLTGEMGHKAKIIMDFIISSTKDSVDRNKDKLSGFYYSVVNNELKRISLYDKIINLFIKNYDRYTVTDEKFTYVFFMFK